MIMFNKHLTQIDPASLPEGVNSKELTPHEIVDLHLQDQSKIIQETQAQQVDSFTQDAS